MKSEGTGSKAPLTESFGNWKNAKVVLLRCWERPQSRRWFGNRQSTPCSSSNDAEDELDHRLHPVAALAGHRNALLHRVSKALGQDRRKWTDARCLLAVITYFPTFKALTHYGNPALEAFNARPRSASPPPIPGSHLATPLTKYSDCERFKNFLQSRALNYDKIEGTPGSPSGDHDHEMKMSGLTRQS